MAAPQDSLNLTRIKSEEYIRDRVHHICSTQPIDLALVAIGISGAGKSTLLNFLAEEEVFQAAEGLKGCTKTVHKHLVNFQTRTIALIDTPGLLDPEALDKELSQGERGHVLLSKQSADFEAYLEEALHEAGEKVDAFLLVFNAQRRWSVEAKWVLQVLNTLGIDHQHMIAVFTHGDVLGDTKVERCKMMNELLSDARAKMYGLADLLEKTEKRWIITESNDVRKSGNSEVWEEVLEKQKSVRPMLNEDFIEIKQKMEAEEEIIRRKNATLKDIEQQESHLREIAELKSIIERCEPEKLELASRLDTQIAKLASDIPEAGLTVEDDLARFTAKHDEMLIALQEKRNHLQTLQSKCTAQQAELGSRASVEATRSRQEQALTNEATLEKARQYWPQFMNGGEQVAEGDERNGGEQDGDKSNISSPGPERQQGDSLESGDEENDQLLHN